MKDCHVLSFRQIKIKYVLKCNFEGISSNLIPIIISGHTVDTVYVEEELKTFFVSSKSGLIKMILTYCLHKNYFTNSICFYYKHIQTKSVCSDMSDYVQTMSGCQVLPYSGKYCQIANIFFLKFMESLISIFSSKKSK